MAAFQEVAEELRGEGVGVVVASSDPREKAMETIQTEALSFTVGFGLNLEVTSAKLGAFYEKRRGILHATGYLVAPNSTVAVACYSTGPIGRFIPEDVLSVVRFNKKKLAGD